MLNPELTFNTNIYPTKTDIIDYIVLRIGIDYFKIKRVSILRKVAKCSH